ncbi:hypothetical protein RV134_370008 [Roseovarius sp. EC-HK134]|nr:hypothetical protein RV134_370008 [Roseovarius sp. EC-HK134]VVT32902.1 hypothetical protein RV420_460017 [Roseovarius sp. EC-SD190]
MVEGGQLSVYDGELVEPRGSPDEFLSC